MRKSFSVKIKQTEVRYSSYEVEAKTEEEAKLKMDAFMNDLDMKGKKPKLYSSYSEKAYYELVKVKE